METGADTVIVGASASGLAVARCLEAAGGTPDNILRITFYVRDQAAGRAALNDEWVKMFPDPASRPARHTLAAPGDGPSLVTCEFTAVLP